MENNFKIHTINSTVVLEKDSKKISINRAPDDDIWFESAEDIATFDLRFSSRVPSEWQTFNLFNNLMKRIIGRFFLNEDNNEYSTLPEDFIDMENKTITWHSDSGTDNVLQLQYLGDIIRIVIKKAEKEHSYNRVRIRTDGSDYERYYQEFTLFFQQLIILAHSFEEKEKKQEPVMPAQSVQTPEARKLSLKRFFPNKKQ